MQNKHQNSFSVLVPPPTTPQPSLGWTAALLIIRASQHESTNDCTLSYEMLDQHLLLARDCLLPFQNLRDFHARFILLFVVSKIHLFKFVNVIRTMITLKRFEKLPAVAAYKKSAKPLPCNNTSAAWGAK